MKPTVEAHPPEEAPVAELVARANQFDDEAAQRLDALLDQMEREVGTSHWPAWLRALGRLESAAMRDRATRLLARRGQQDPAVRALILELASPQDEPGEDEGGRIVSLLALGHLRDAGPPELTLLRAALDSTRPAVGSAAATALGQLGRSSAEAAAVLLEGSGATIDRILPGLAVLCDLRTAALAALEEAVASPKAEMRRAAARALAEAPTAACHLPLLEALLEDERPEVQVLALNALARASTAFPAAALRVRAVASQAGHSLRLRALRCLGEAAAESPEARQAVRDFLAEADPPALVGITLGIAAAARRNVKACLPLMVEVSRSNDAEVLTTLAQVVMEVAAARAMGSAPLLYGLIGIGSGPNLFTVLAAEESDVGRLADDIVHLWCGEGEPVAALAMVRETLLGMGESAAQAESVYRVLENLTHFATVEEILASAADVGAVMPAAAEGTPHLLGPLERLYEWLDRLIAYETESDPEAQAAIIQRALDELERLKAEFEQARFPEARVLASLAGRWKGVVVQTLFSARRGTELALQVADRKIQRSALSTISLELKNRGGGVAYQIDLEMTPSPHYALHTGSHHIPTLAPGESHVLDFTFTPSSAGLDRFRVEFRARFSDFAEAERWVTFAEEVACRPVAPFTPIPNPYIPGLPLAVGSELFMGRDDIFRFVEQSLGTGPQKRVIVLVGQRRMGKTSILRQIPLRLNREFLPAFVDCQGLEPHGLGNLLCHMAYVIADALQAEGVPNRIPDLASFQERPFFTFEYEFIRPVLAALGSRRLLLMVDEFQALCEAVDAQHLDPAIFGFLRSLMQHQERLFFLFSGLQKPLEESRDYWQPVFNVALCKQIGLLEHAFARQLIERPVQGVVHYDPLAIDELLRLCCGQPYLTQLFCDRLINHLNEIGERQVCATDVQHVIPHVFSAGVNHFYSSWEELPPREKIVLIAMSVRLVQHPFATLSAITRYLRERGIAAELEEVTTVLESLLGRDLVAFVSTQPPGYAFRVLLFQHWIQKEMLQALVGGRIKWS